MRGRLDGRGAGSGASFERPLWGAREWRDGKQIWYRAFGSEAQAPVAAAHSGYGAEFRNPRFAGRLAADYETTAWDEEQQRQLEPALRAVRKASKH